MFDSTIKVLEMKNMPIPQTIHAIATGPTAEFSAIFWGSPSTPLPIIELTTMDVSASKPYFCLLFFSVESICISWLLFFLNHRISL